MMFAAAIQQASLADPPPASAIGAATGWIGDLLFGPLATSIAIVAIAWIGFAMLSGQIDIRRGLAVVFGCFLLFGAWGIADGLRSSATVQSGSTAAAAPPPPTYLAPPASANNTNAFDPYAGAAVMPPRQ
jgi:type IV secretory pathway VirB2 component (pilin)